MMIEFLCPNGHRIRCPEERAGQPAKCPKCGVKFRIPEPSDQAPSTEDTEETTPAGAEWTGGSASGKTQATMAEQQIEFLCPNGHRLHGPASLQGRPGQCPECNSRFRIPTYDDVPDENEEEAEEEIGVVGAGSDTKVTFDDTESLAGSQTSSGKPGDEVTTALRLENSGFLTTRNHAASLAELLAKLFEEKTAEAIVKLYLTDGETVTPSHFVKDASQGSHALFASEDSSGFKLMLVAWASIARIEIQGLKELPDWVRGA
jgi:hypothetical protein